MAEPVANVVGIITGTVLLLEAIRRSIEATKDVPQQIRHLQNTCTLVGEELSQIRTRLEQNHLGLHEDDYEDSYYYAIAGVVETIHMDLDDIYGSIKNRAPSKTWPGRIWQNQVKKRDAFQAIDLKVKLNMKALARIDTNIGVLTLTTLNLWRCEMTQRTESDQVLVSDIRDLMKRIARTGVRLPDDTRDPGNYGLSVQDLEKADYYANSLRDDEADPTQGVLTLISRAWKRASVLAIRYIGTGPDTPTTRQSRRTSLVLSIEPGESLAQMETHVPIEELHFRHEEALAMSADAEKQELPDVAAFFHSQAMAIRSHLAHLGDCPLSFEQRAEMEVKQISILFDCFLCSQREEGYARLTDLAQEVDNKALSGDTDSGSLFQARRNIGHQYYTQGRHQDAIKYSRAALFEGDLLTDHDQNKSAIKDLVQVISDAYRRLDMNSVRENAFKKYMEQTLGYNPLAEEDDLEVVLELCREWKFPFASDMHTHAHAQCFGSIKNDEGNSLLHKAVGTSGTAVGIIRKLSADHTTLDVVNRHGLTPLFTAVEAKNLDAVRVLLDQGASLDIRKPRQDGLETVLHVCEDPEIMKTLVGRLTERDPRSDSGWSASSPGRATTPSDELSLLEHITIGAKSVNSSTALHLACYRGDHETAKVLVVAGADVNARNDDRETPLIITCHRNFSGCREQATAFIQFLVEHGAQVDAEDEDGGTAKQGLRSVNGLSNKEIHALFSPITTPRTGSIDSGLGLSVKSRSSSSSHFKQAS